MSVGQMLVATLIVVGVSAYAAGYRHGLTDRLWAKRFRKDEGELAHGGQTVTEVVGPAAQFGQAHHRRLAQTLPQGALGVTDQGQDLAGDAALPFELRAGAGALLVLLLRARRRANDHGVGL